jgi:integrase
LRRWRTKPRLHGVLDPRLYRAPDCEEASNFDRCLDYEKFAYAVAELFNEVVELRQQERRKTLELWSSYLALTLIMLVNGLRIGEALRAAARFYETGERRFKLKAEKGGDPRGVLIPEFIERGDLEHVYKEQVRRGEGAVAVRFSVWFNGVFGVNPHSIRYAFIRYHASTGKTPGEVARALGLREAGTVKKYYLRGLYIGEGEEDGGAGGSR